MGLTNPLHKKIMRSEKGIARWTYLGWKGKQRI
jgi:hypothetical protein